MARCIVLIGTYTEPILFGTGELLNAHGKGIYLYDLEDDHLTERAIGAATNASFLITDAVHRMVYTTNELKQWNGMEGGAVSAYKLDLDNNKLTLVNTQPVHGKDPCHVVLSPDGRSLYCANFMSGSVTVLPVMNDGSIGEDSCFIQHEGSGPDPKRQAGPHAHGVFLSPSRKWLYVPDLGVDKLICYRINENEHMLIPVPDRDIDMPDKGEGSRHMAFHPNGHWLYVNTEMGSSVYMYNYEEESGHCELKQKLSTVPEGTDLNTTSTAAIKLHPNGKILYVSNRGHNSLATYAIDEDNGLMTLLSIQPTGGNIPREFAISSDGNTMIVAHQSSDDAVVYRINPIDGSLHLLERIEVPNPICVQIYNV